MAPTSVSLRTWSSASGVPNRKAAVTWSSAGASIVDDNDDDDMDIVTLQL